MQQQTVYPCSQRNDSLVWEPEDPRESRQTGGTLSVTWRIKRGKGTGKDDFGLGMLSHEPLNTSTSQGEWLPSKKTRYAEDSVCEGTKAECYRVSSTSEDPGAGRSTEHLKTEPGGFLCSRESQGERRSAEIREMGKGRVSQVPAGPTKN